jgi:hypothetical protein
MDKAKAKFLVSILRDSSLYQTMSHEEKISLLARLEREYSTIFNDHQCEDYGETESQCKR